MSLQDILAKILRTSNPDTSDEDLKRLNDANPDNLYPIFGRLDPNNAQISPQPVAPEGMGDPRGPLPTDPSDPAPADPAIDMGDPRGPLPTDPSDPVAPDSGSPQLPPIPDASSMQWEDPNAPAAAPEAVTGFSAPKAAPKAPESTSGMLPIDTADQQPSNTEAADREKLHSALDKRAKTAGILTSIGGSLGDAIENTGVAFGGPGAQHDTAAQAQKIIQDKKVEEEGDFEKKLLNDPNSATSQNSRAMLLRISPDLAKDPSFQSMTAQMIKDKMPFTDAFIKAQTAKDMKELQLEYLKNQKLALSQNQHNSEQDRLEAQAQQRILSLRGDQSLARTELQRDAATSAYTLLEQAKREGRKLTKPEYFDLLGQVWQARTGKSPTDQDIKNLDTQTFNGDINKMTSYWTGKPAGASTQEVYNNLQQFVAHTGQKADLDHEAYMAPHLIKPQGLDDNRWQPIVNTARGRSFADVVKNVQGTSPSGGQTQKIGRFNVVVH